MTHPEMLLYSAPMPSTFMRLYRYAKAVGAEAKENYTTEALRAAIESDPRPITLALHDLGVIASEPRGPIQAQTQFAVRGTGIIDLQLVFVEGEMRRLVWIEVKVDAEESGDQIANYQRFMATMAEEHRPTLVVLGPKPLRDGVPWLSWQRLRAAIKRTESTSPYWTDLITYLGELRMADNYDEAVTPREAQALFPARSLLGKLVRILTPFAAEANGIWRGAGWPDSEKKVTEALLSVFQTHGTFTIANGISPSSGVSAGLYHEPLTNDGWLGLWLWIKPNRVAERQAILGAANQVTTWGDEWHRDQGEWELFGAYRRLVEVESHANGQGWLSAKLVQLRDAGLLDLMRR